MPLLKLSGTSCRASRSLAGGSMNRVLASHRSFHCPQQQKVWPEVAPSRMAALWKSNHALHAEGEEADSTGFFHAMVQDTFAVADLNHDGVLDKHEFRSLVKSLDLDWSDARISASFDAADLNMDGVIQPGEWHALMHKALGEEESITSGTLADEAEAQEAEGTGYTGMLKDSQTLAERLKARMPK
mmetsp:Transcript_152087/g.265126  ORF Transcript_152087/g.265126 Transcript_152087/m.265126 type:complete len:186 (+) Transcript_152087:45-602(+)